MNNALGFAAEIGITITLLTVGGVFLGRYLDGRYNIAPFGLVAGMLVGIILASVILVIRTQRLMK